MKCPDPVCGHVGTDKFCEQCGKKMVEDAHILEVVISCTGQLEDGSPCTAKLTKGKRFCSACGTKVDPQLFAGSAKAVAPCPVMPTTSDGTSPSTEDMDNRLNANTISQTTTEDGHQIDERKTNHERCLEQNACDSLGTTVSEVIDIKGRIESVHIKESSADQHQVEMEVDEATELAANCTSENHETSIFEDTCTTEQAEEDLKKSQEQELQNAGDQTDTSAVDVNVSPTTTNEDDDKEEDQHSDEGSTTTDDEDDIDSPAEATSNLSKEDNHDSRGERHKRRKRETNKEKKKKKKREKRERKTHKSVPTLTDKEMQSTLQMKMDDTPVESTPEIGSTSSGKVFGQGKDNQSKSDGNNVNNNNTSGLFDYFSDKMNAEGIGSNVDCPTHHESSHKDTERKPTKPEDTSNAEKFRPATRSQTKGKKTDAYENDPKKKPDSAASTSRKQTTQKQNPGDVQVHFHVLLSPDFKFDPFTDKVIIRLGADALGGWNSNKHVLKFSKEQTTGEVGLDASFYIPRKLLVEKHLEYKYFVERYSKSKKGNKRKNVWEKYVRDGKSGEGINRFLKLPEKWKRTEHWHQFDGIVNREPRKGFWNRASDRWNARNKLAEDGKKAIKIFSENIVKEMKKSTDEESVKLNVGIVDSLSYSCLRIYVIDTHCWDTEPKLKMDLAANIVPPLMEHVVSFLPVKPEESDEVFTRRMFATMSLLAVVKNLTPTNLLGIHSDWRAICRSMIPNLSPDRSICKELDFTKKHFAANRSFIKDALVCIARGIARQSKDATWLYLMPLIHFLSGACEPYEIVRLDISHDNNRPVWWGITDVGEDAIKTFKQHNTRWEIPLHEVIEVLEPLFAMDYLLPRTIMASLKHTEVNDAIQTAKIPLEVSCATIIYYLRYTRPKIWHSYGIGPWGSITSDEMVVVKCLESLRASVQKENGARVDAATLNLRCIMSYKMTQEAVKTDRVSPLVTGIAVFLYCSSQMKINTIDDVQQQQTASHLDTRLLALSADVGGWLEKYRCHFITTTDMDTQIQVSESAGIFTEKYVEYYCRKVHKFKSCLQECMSDVAFKAIHGGYGLNISHFHDHERRTFGRLLCNMLKNNWGKLQVDSADSGVCLNQCLPWPPLQNFIHIYNAKKREKHWDILDEDCNVMMAQIISKLEDTFHSLKDGTIKIGDLQLVCEQSQKFQELINLIKSDNQVKNFSSYVADIINCRVKELEAFQRQAALMGTFASLCQYLPQVDRSSVDEVLCKQAYLHSCSLCEFCKPCREVSSLKNIACFKPMVTAFRVSPDLLKDLPDIESCNKSSIFIQMWDKRCRECTDTCDCVDDVYKEVWIPVKARWDEVSTRIQEGNIRFHELEKIVGRALGDDYVKLGEELKIIGLNEQQRSTRIKQLKQFRQLTKCANGASVVLKFSREFKMKGNFSEIEEIAHYDTRDFEMKDFNSSLIKTCEFLKHLSEEKSHCLDSFVQCRNLVTWLKESMSKSGLKELKVFVDLAFMSAGDEPMNIARVQCLHSAVTGYAPLIFDLKQQDDYKRLLELCNVVWKELEANPKLPKMLEDTNRHIEWLKQIKEAHGSVEVTSMFQAEAINADGVYRVGTAVHTRLNQHQELDPMHTITLTVCEDKEQKSRRKYTCTQLQDLQSRLMLVAGKAQRGNDSVERFTEVFDSVTRLSHVYVKLCMAGCVLFKDWTTTFLCDQSKPVCTIMEFGHGKLKGRRNEAEDLQSMIPKLASFMEKCYSEWLQYIQEKRDHYMHLNYFTVDQLVILQQELVKLGTDDEPLHLVYPLLSAVKSKCTKVDLIEAMKAAKENITDRIASQHPEDDDSCHSDEHEMVEDEEEQKLAFVQELLNSGYSEMLARRALEFVSPDQVSDGIVWCMEHEDEVDVSSHAVDKQVMDEGGTRFDGWSQSDVSIQSLISRNVAALENGNEVGVKPLQRDLNKLWSDFLNSLSTNMKDYLNLEHLGIILDCLARRETECIERKFPPNFFEGSPNLLICPQADVLHTALAVYMFDQNQPLPQPDEVLLCSPQTTIDEVDIFWRRALFHGGQKIHCLVNADLLDFDVSEASEHHFEEYMQRTHGKETSYRLVVICGSDNENRSRIVASLFKHQRPTLPHTLEPLRDYLASKLRESATSGVKPASYVDVDRSSVRLIKSWRAGIGKTLYKVRMEEKLSRLNPRMQSAENVSIPLKEKTINLHHVIQRLLTHTAQPEKQLARIFHIDLANEVQNGADFLLFNLLVLGCLTDKTGYVWRRSPLDLYLVETMPLMIHNSKICQDVGDQYVHQMLGILPEVICRSPQESIILYSNDHFNDHDQLFDKANFESAEFQRPYQYLSRQDQGRALTDVNPHSTEGSPATCLQTLLRHCGVQDPSWSELQHFVGFLNTQLRDFEQNVFVSAAAAEDLPGFASFVLKFLIQMSRDFSTRSLNMSEDSPCVRPQQEVDRVDMEGVEEEEEDDGQMLREYQLRRTWESSPHPYLFFTADRVGFTFLGFYIERQTGNLKDLQTGHTLQQGIMAPNLYDALVRNRIPIQENFDDLPRPDKITKLCSVMGNDMPYDPDDTYELTTDNAKKIMAIFMRFRCNIPVIIMGETGCGKTRLVKFMCALQSPPGVVVNNMILMKVHGGTTNADIKRKVREAEKIAQQNVETHGQHMYTVLFFDEANTTESIGLIKEIMCDRSLEGEKMMLCDNLKMVAACNPYRKHSEELIQKLEKAGLGYHIKADETTDKLGHVPMRRLVYRVQPLPQSLLPLVWDFGQLNTQVEELYIRQMVRRYICAERLPNMQGLPEVVSSVLTASQEYMRQQEDECSFVSLRDVDRVLCVMSWFYQQSRESGRLFTEMNQKLRSTENNTDDSSDQEEDYMEETPISYITRALVLALGVCYHACLRTRDEYREYIAEYFREPCKLPGGSFQIEEEINVCQDVFLDNVQLERNIARNMALKENMFMMVVCIELRIPLFLVGKPGSSKSLAKTIVSDAMQGNASRFELFSELKQAQMVSFQCSPLSTPDGIVGTFRQCAQFQKDKDLDTFVSIVVLDEVGLAEDSPRMPLKTLHPLLEDGCQGDEEPEPYKKVAFIGISNWALDPAKMNRGILVQREVPDVEELCSSARGICESGDMKGRMEPLIQPLADSYLEIFEKATQHMREFYGLRDFYSLVKMVNMFVERSKRPPTWHEMVHAIKRNFGGMDHVNPVECFKNNVCTVVAFEEKPKRNDPDCTTSGLIQACLFDKNNMQSESRYLLLLTENYGALTILQQQVLARQTDIRPITIFGSSFRSDQEYTQVCRNINKIKVCMETGNTVILLNLENLYESLYDALNQYYVYFGGERYVDLGLGTHRVKCPVHQNFRLIVVAEKQTVYKEFPIPLINRLEKHFLTINTMLSKPQQDLVKKLEEWAKRFASPKTATYRMDNRATVKVGDVFMGYHDDTCSAIILHVWQSDTDDEQTKQKILLKAKKMLLWCATPDSVVRLAKTDLPLEEQEQLKHLYHSQQQHDSILDYLHNKIVVQKRQRVLTQVTTHSKLLATFHRIEISKATGIPLENVMLLDTLTSFDTEQQFSNKVHHHFHRQLETPSLLIIQCDSGDINANLIACARYCVMDEYENAREMRKAEAHIVFIVQLPQIAGGCFSGFQCGIWHSVHIDELYSGDLELPPVQEMQHKSVAALVGDAVGTTDEDMEVDENIPTDRGHFEPMEYETVPREKQYPGPMVSIVDGSDTNNSDIPVDVCSITLQFDRAEKEVHVHKGRSTGTLYKKTLDVKGLILQSVHAALSMVKDKTECSERTTERVSLLLKLLHKNEAAGRPSFLQGLSRLVAKLLEERENATQVSFMSTQWLVNEAAQQENMQKAGTFRRACLQTIESKIAPILAGVIAHLDINQNLDLMNDEAAPWQQTLWQAVVSAPKALSLKFGDLLSPYRQSELPQFTVRTTGYGGHFFKPIMPFSWEVYELVEKLIKQQVPDEIDDISSWIVEILNDGPLGRVLQDNVDEENTATASDHYLSDFVHFKYHAATYEEHVLICEAIHSIGVGQGHERKKGILHLIVGIHQDFNTLANRLTCFRNINNVWQECSKVYSTLKEQNPDHFMVHHAKDLPFTGVCLLVENLTPANKELDEPIGRSRWLKKVHRFRPVVEAVIKMFSEQQEEYSASSGRCIERARLLWNRVVIVKLFLEHVCASDNKDEKITIRHCMPLWKMLGEEADMKQKRALEIVEKFLKTCNSTAVKCYFGQPEKCCFCEKTMENALIMLPCKEKVCQGCFSEVKVNKACSNCDVPVPEDLQPETASEQREGETKMKDYQKRCNTFFMDMVSQLCFTGNTPPSQDVITKLLTYITSSPRKGMQVTKQMSVFETGLDPTPVFRSFLLQHLLRTSDENEILKQFLEQAESVLRQAVHNTDVEQHYIELSLLVIQCMEDLFKNRAIGNEISCATHCLNHCMEHIDEEELTESKLISLAKARMGLAVAADCIQSTLDKQQPSGASRKLIEAANTLCSERESRWPLTFLVKYICRSFGMDTYQRLCGLVHYRWLNVMGMNEQQRIEVPDRFIILGDDYRLLRESLTKVVIGEDIEHLAQIYQGRKTGGTGRVDLMLQLAIYREVTCSNLYPPGEQRVTTEVGATLDGFIQASGLKQPELVQILVHNALPGHLTVMERGDFLKQGIQCILVHFLCTVGDLQGDKTLMQPLIGMMNTPQAFVDAFIPTMPQDDLDDIKEALLAARAGNENPVLYRCPNGHPYVIGDCGRPAIVGTCKVCRTEIGGQGYVLRTGNTLYQGLDETKTGHILGPAGNQVQESSSERTLTPVQCTCLRLLTHLALYIGSLQNAQEMEGLFKPRQLAQDIPEFLWAHIKADIQNLQHVLGKSKDDALLILHSIILKIMSKNNSGEHQSQEMCRLSSKAARSRWEQQFSDRFLKPVLENAESTLKTNNQLLVNDKRLGGDPLLCLLYETGTSQQQPGPAMIQEVPQVWRYRIPISLNHLKQEFENNAPRVKKGQKQHRVLQSFLENEPVLRALRYVPSILRLQRGLLQKYQRRLDKAEASSIVVQHLIQDEILGNDTSSLLEDFRDAWDIVRGHLKNYACPSEIGGSFVTEEYCNRRVDDRTPISMLLPSNREAGLCSYALLDFLLRKQNDFLDSYMKKSVQRKSSDQSKIAPAEVTSAHLISYDPQHDLLPLIFANCQYSFEIGKGTKIEYDFTSLERQLMDRFFFSKYKIAIERFLQVELMVYRTEFTNATVFAELADKIPQTSLNAPVKSQICSEIRSLPDLCQSMDHLDITISFLKSIGGEPTTALAQFMEEKLKMSTTLHSQKARQCCQFDHTRSLWLLLALQRSKLMLHHKCSRQSIFESVLDTYLADIPGSCRDQFKDFLKNLTVEKLSQIVEVLHEFILLEVAKRQNNTDDEDYGDNRQKKLGIHLVAYIDATESPTVDSAVLENLPEDILYIHSVHTWMEACQTLVQKQTGRRR